MNNLHEHPTPEEVRLTDILMEVLEIPEIRRTDRYLDLGGNSVSLFLVVERIRNEMGVDIDPQLFFDPNRSSIAGLAKEIALAANRSQQG